MTSSLENLKTISRLGAGAVVLKSVFEEQIKFEAGKFIESDQQDIKPWNEAFQEIVSTTESYYDEAYNYLTSYAEEHTLKKYLSFVREAKNSLHIPVIASINCNSQYDWQYFAKRIQEAGADALELNVYLLPSDLEKKGEEIEQVYFDIIKEVRKYVTIPVAIKTGYYFSSLAKTLVDLSETGIAGLTLFNRPYNPDIDIDNLLVNASNMLSNESEYTNTLRWVAILSGRVKCDIAASTGIHNHQTVIKQLLAGADVVQMASVFYKNGFDVLPGIISGIEQWMVQHSFTRISDFKGMLSKKNIKNPASYERVQFIRLFSGLE